MTATRVFTEDPRYRTALAELPASATAAPTIRGADIVTGPRVVDGTADQVLIASTDGSTDLDALPDGIVVLERPWFRTDVAQDVAARCGWFPRIEVEVTAPALRLRAVLADAAAWARVLAGDDLRTGEGASTRHGGIAEGHAGEAVVTIQVRRREAGAAALRISAIGPRRIEIRIEGERRSARVRVADEDGELTLPERWETSARVVLRRAVVARAGADPVDDLALFRRDARVADELLRLINQGDERDRQPRIP